MTQNKPTGPRPAAMAELARQVRQAQRLVREARRRLTKIEQNSGIVLIVPRRAPTPTET
jgi:hypothetical protein